MTEYYDAPYLDEAEHAALDHTGVPGVPQSGAYVADDRISISSTGEVGVVDGVGTAIHWDSIDRTAGTAIAVNDPDDTLIDLTEGTYVFIVYVEAIGPTSVYGSVDLNGDVLWPYDTFVLGWSHDGPTFKLPLTAVVQYGPAGGQIVVSWRPIGANGDLTYAGLDVKRIA